MGTPESSEVPAPQLGREAWRYAVPMLRRTNVEQEAGGLQQGGCGQRKGRSVRDPDWEILARANFWRNKYSFSPKERSWWDLGTCQSWAEDPI